MTFRRKTKTQPRPFKHPGQRECWVPHSYGQRCSLPKGHEGPHR